MNVKKIQISGSRATSEAYSNKTKLPFDFIYKKENDNWRFDLTQILMNTEIPMKAAAEQVGMEENEFIFAMLETISGSKPTEELWKPEFSK